MVSHEPYACVAVRIKHGTKLEITRYSQQITRRFHFDTQSTGRGVYERGPSPAPAALRSAPGVELHRMFAGRRLGRIALGCMPGALLCTSRTINCNPSQEQPGYAIPPESITALVDYKPIPSVSVQPRIQEHLLYCHYQTMLSLEDISCPTLKLAGARFNPCTLNSHGTNGVNLYYTAFELQSLATREKRMVTGLPEGARMEHLAWSPDGQKLAFSLRTSEVGDDSACRLWIMDVASASAAPVWP